MRPSSILTLACILSAAMAQNETETSVTVQSADFNLVIQSHNKSLDGLILDSCHNGAAHEAPCIIRGVNSTSSYTHFQFNTTEYICTNTNSTGTVPIPCFSTPADPAFTTGYITWWLNYGGENGPARVSQAMALQYYDNSNVALAQIGFAYGGNTGTYVAFDKDDLMNILAYQDDTLEPSSEELYPTPIVLYRWYICQTYYSGYRYTALAWVMGKHSPQNPTCQKVNVKRVWV